MEYVQMVTDQLVDYTLILWAEEETTSGFLIHYHRTVVLWIFHDKFHKIRLRFGLCGYGGRSASEFNNPLLHVPCVRLGIICHIIRDFHLSCDFSAVLRGAAEQVLEESDSDICSDVGTVLADQNDLGKEDSEL